MDNILKGFPFNEAPRKIDYWEKYEEMHENQW